MITQGGYATGFSNTIIDSCIQGNPHPDVPRGRRYYQNHRYETPVQNLPNCACPDGYTPTVGYYISDSGESGGTRGRETLIDGLKNNGAIKTSLYSQSSGFGDDRETSYHTQNHSDIVVHCFGD